TTQVLGEKPSGRSRPVAAELKANCGSAVASISDQDLRLKSAVSKRRAYRSLNIHSERICGCDRQFERANRSVVRLECVIDDSAVLIVEIRRWLGCDRGCDQHAGAHKSARAEQRHPAAGPHGITTAQLPDREYRSNACKKSFHLWHPALGPCHPSRSSNY